MKQKYFIFFVMYLFFLNSLPAEKEIRETVDVNAWTIPLFIVDSQNNPVQKITEKDIVLTVNGKEIENFFLEKIETEVDTDPFGNISNQESSRTNRSIILLFDTATAEASALMRLKSISEKVVMNAVPGSQFIIFSIAPLKGLQYIAGPLKKKSEVIKIIRKKVIPRRNFRSIDQLLNDVYVDGLSEDMSNDQIAMIKIKLGKSIMQKNISFAGAFKDLNLAVNNIPGLKFIYLLSQGIAGGTGIPSNKFAPMAKSIIKSGGIFFIINPRHSGSGENFLKMIASLSGGQYLSGSQNSINQSINKIKKGYYEIGFQLTGEINPDNLFVNVSSRKGNLSIMTVKSLRLTKQFEEMTQKEQKIMVLNLITGSNLFDVKIKYEKIREINQNKDSQSTIYSYQLPPGFLNNKITLFKVYLDKRFKKLHFERSLIFPESKLIHIRFDNERSGEHFFVLLNEDKETALIRGLDVPEISISRPKLKNGIIQFSILNFFKSSKLKGSPGYVKTLIRFLGENNKKLYEKEKFFTIIKDQMTLALSYSKYKNEIKNIQIIATDLLTEKTKNLFYSFQ